MEISIRPLTDLDLDAADNVLQAAYQSASQKERLKRYLRLQPDGWIAAYIEERLVGLVGAIHYGAFAYIGLMGVHPDAQRRGVGKALMEHILSWLDRQRCPTILLDATIDGVALYTHFGFVDNDEATHWQRPQRLQPPQYPTDAITTIPQPLWSAPTTSYTRLTPLYQQDIHAIAQFDASYFGADRTSVLSTYVVEASGRAFITRGADEQITGYLVAQQSTIGPWVASNQQDAEVLLQQALTLPFQRQATVLNAASNKEASSLLHHYGFICVRTLRHMHCGQDTSWRRRDVIYGQASFAVG